MSAMEDGVTVAFTLLWTEEGVVAQTQFNTSLASGLETRPGSESEPTAVVDLVSEPESLDGRNTTNLAEDLAAHSPLSGSKKSPCDPIVST
jgi:hypothetical protein